MRALSKLIYLNNPDLVLFVGEALVGNDAVDQLSKFNQVQYLYLGVSLLLGSQVVFYIIISCFLGNHSCFCIIISSLPLCNIFVFFLQKLADLSTSPNPRLIDGILLTKFDTIDDKVNDITSHFELWV